MVTTRRRLSLQLQQQQQLEQEHGVGQHAADVAADGSPPQLPEPPEPQQPEQLDAPPLRRRQQQQQCASPLTPERVPPEAANGPVQGKEEGEGEARQQQQQQQQRRQAHPPTTALKSALKAPRPAAASGGAAEGRGEAAAAAAEATPAGPGVKKRVRIHSSNNVVHVFGGSSSDGRHAVAGGGDGAGAAGASEEDGATPQSRWAAARRRAPITLGTPKLLHYQAFIRGIRGGVGDHGGGSSAQGGGVGPAQARLRAEGGAASQHAQQQQQQEEQLQRRRRQQGWEEREPGHAVGENGAGGTAWEWRRRRAGPPTLLPWAALAASLGWMVASSALIFINKAIMVDRGFRSPFALTALGSATSTLLGWVAGRAGVAPLRPHPALETTLTKLFPVAFCTAATLFLGNYAYLGLSVAFINILKALMPVVTLLTSVALGQERPSLAVAACLVLIAAGTAVATAQESASSHFSWLGFTSFMLSVVFEALRVVLVERLLGKQRYNAIEVLVFQGPLTLLLLLLGAVVSEREHLLKQGLTVLARHPALFAGACLSSFLVNAFSFLAIQTSSSLTFKVAGCLKNAVVVWLGVASGDSLTRKEAGGYCLSLLGFLGYTLLRALPLGVGGGAHLAAAPPRRAKLA